MKKLTREKLLDEYYAWTLDGKDAAISPKLSDEDLTKPNSEVDVLQLFEGRDYKPEELINVLIPSLEAIFKKYFYDVFYSPIGVRGDYGELRFNRLVLPKSDIVQIERLLLRLSSKLNKCVILNFIAEVFHFQIFYLKEDLTVERVKSFKDLNKEGEEYQNMLKKFADERHNKIEMVRFSFSDGPFEFKHPYILRLIQKNLSRIESDPYLKFEFPHLNDYQLFFKKELILSLYRFLRNEEDFLNSSEININSAMTEFIAHILIICKINFVDAYDNKPLSDIKKIQNQIKTIINRSSY